MEISKINFPIFAIEDDNIWMKDGVVFAGDQVVDDTNVKLPDYQGKVHLAVRRIHTPLQYNLYPLNKMIADVAGLVKNKSRYYIDWEGKVFNYQKEKFHRLKYHKIKTVTTCESFSLLYVHGVNFPIEVKRPPREEFQYAGILYKNGFPWLLYEYCTIKKRQTVRKV